MGAGLVGPITLNGKEAGEKVGPDGEGQQPDAHHKQYQAAPALHLLRPLFQGIDQPLLRRTNEDCQRKHEQGHGQRGNHEGCQRRAAPAADQCVPGQTGQDGARSTKPGQDIAEAVEAEGQRRPLAT